MYPCEHYVSNDYHYLWYRVIQKSVLYFFVHISQTISHEQPLRHRVPRSLEICLTSSQMTWRVRSAERALQLSPIFMIDTTLSWRSLSTIPAQILKRTIWIYRLMVGGGMICTFSVWKLSIEGYIFLTILSMFPIYILFRSFKKVCYVMGALWM